MIERWLAHVPSTHFFDEFYLRKPFALAQTGSPFISLLTWQVFAGVLAGPEPPDLLVVRDGRLVSGPEPRSGEAAERLFDAGTSVVVRNAERHDAGLRDLAQAFADDFGAKIAVQLYATPRGHHSFGWHYDAEEVFILQTAGTKHYFLRENTVRPYPLLEAMPTDMAYEKESSPLISCTLLPGDWLYVPAGYWHVARAVERSLSISLGVLPPTGLDLFDALRQHFVESAAWRRRLPPGRTARALAAELSREATRILADADLFGQAVDSARRRHAALAHEALNRARRRVGPRPEHSAGH